MNSKKQENSPAHRDHGLILLKTKTLGSMLLAQCQCTCMQLPIVQKLKKEKEKKRKVGVLIHLVSMK